MKLVPAANSVWHLIDEAAPPAANLIAVLHGLVEVLAVKALCEHMLSLGGVRGGASRPDRPHKAVEPS